MRFIKIFIDKKFTLISIFLLLYVILNLLDGERGLISYYQKKLFSKKLANVEKKNSLLSENLDLDYLETIYRKKFMIGKSNEKVYTNY